jgi:thioesterase domain-containing protein
MNIGSRGPLYHGVDTSLHPVGNFLGDPFRAGGLPYLADVVYHVAQQLRVQGQDFRLLGKVNAYLGNLPRRDGSNLADRLSNQQVRLGGLEHLFDNVVDTETLLQPL